MIKFCLVPNEPAVIRLLVRLVGTLPPKTLWACAGVQSTVNLSVLEFSDGCRLTTMYAHVHLSSFIFSEKNKKKGLRPFPFLQM